MMASAVYCFTPQDNLPYSMQSIDLLYLWLLEKSMVPSTSNLFWKYAPSCILRRRYIEKSNRFSSLYRRYFMWCHQVMTFIGKCVTRRRRLIKVTKLVFQLLFICKTIYKMLSKKKLFIKKVLFLGINFFVARVPFLFIVIIYKNLSIDLSNMEKGYKIWIKMMLK